MTILQGLGLFSAMVIISLFVYLVVRLSSAAYFRSKRQHESIMSQMTYKHLKETFGFDRRKRPREVPREAEK